MVDSVFGLLRRMRVRIDKRVESDVAGQRVLEKNERKWMYGANEEPCSPR